MSNGNNPFQVLANFLTKPISVDEEWPTYNQYKTQHGDILQNKRPYVYDDYKREILSNIPAEDLMNL